MSKFERIQETARRFGWNVHYGGHFTRWGITLERDSEAVQIDLDRRSRITRAARLGPFEYGEYEVLDQVRSMTQNKLDRVLGLVTR